VHAAGDVPDGMYNGGEAERSAVGVVARNVVWAAVSNDAAAARFAGAAGDSQGLCREGQPEPRHWREG
jgi:hypothetical protein